MADATIVELSKFVRTKDSDAWRDRDTQAFTMAFVYTPNGHFIVKGMLEAVKAYVKKTYPLHLCEYVMFGKSMHRSYWRFCDEYIQVFGPRDQRKKGFKKAEYKIGDKHYRRLPRRWIPEFDAALSDLFGKKVYVRR